MKIQSLVDIIIIEDNIYDADLSIRAIKSIKCTDNIVHFEDGEEALEYLLEQSEKQHSGRILPKLILLDLKLNGMSGKEILRKIKENEKISCIPVAILSSSNQQNDITDCYKAGANAYIIKPIEYKDYMKQISGLAYFWLKINTAI